MAEQIPNDLIESVTAGLLAAGSVCGDSSPCAGMRANLIQFIAEIRSAMYPQIFGSNGHNAGTFAVNYSLQNAYYLLGEMLSALQPDVEENSRIVEQFFLALPAIKAMLETDIQAAYEGDPAARNREEIMLAYPAFEAISIYRLAHQLYTLGVPMLPRMMTETAHRNTGIDIHPGASIGAYFFIDHGTGVVIGETTTIGHHAKLYQGVTLGAKSFQLDENGNPIKGIKRHPDLGDYVVVYAGATILGGQTRIGNRCTIGGNVWLTHSVEDGKTVLAAEVSANKIF